MTENGHYSWRYAGRYWLPPLLGCALIFYQSHHAVVIDGPDLPCIDKVVHFGMFGVLAVLFYRAFESLESRFYILPPAASAFGVTTLYGLSDEIHQYFVPSRSFEWLDFVADLLGALVFVVVWSRIRSR